jgi:dUTP pyrophosphatase
MQKIAKFEKVSFGEFSKDAASFDADLRAAYDGIILPSRGTKGSAGYDFRTPFGFSLAPRESVIIPTGVRVKIEDGWLLSLYPRSGLGFRYRLQLDNTVGIIDSDYYYSGNEGHIMCKITNCSLSEKTVTLKSGEAFCQGIFTEYGICSDDTADKVRDGGFGSTGK